MQVKLATDASVAVKSARFDGTMYLRQAIIGSNGRATSFEGAVRNLVLDISLTNNGPQSRDRYWECEIVDSRGRRIDQGPAAPSTVRGESAMFLVEPGTTVNVELTFGIPDDLSKPFQLECDPGVWVTFDLPSAP